MAIQSDCFGQFNRDIASYPVYEQWTIRKLADELRGNLRMAANPHNEPYELDNYINCVVEGYRFLARITLGFNHYHSRLK